MTASHPSAAPRTSTSFATSPGYASTRCGHSFTSSAAWRLNNRTSWPRSSSASTVARPTTPVPPVTRTFTAILSVESQGLIWHTVGQITVPGQLVAEGLGSWLVDAGGDDFRNRPRRQPLAFVRARRSTDFPAPNQRHPATSPSSQLPAAATSCYPALEARLSTGDRASGGLVLQRIAHSLRNSVNALRKWLVAGIALTSVMACGETGETYTIASVSPWNEAYGLMSRQGAELAVETINRRGGINSRRLTLLQLDDEGTGAKAAAVAQELVGIDTVIAIVGHANSSATVAAARIYDGQIAAVSPSASSPEITGLSSWLFRVIASDSANGRDLARFATALGHEKAAVLYENNSYGRGLADSFRRAFRGKITALEPVAVDGKEVEPYLAYLRLHNPGLIVAAGSEGSGLEILREARRQGLGADFLGGDGWTGITSDTVAAEGAYVATPFTA